MPGRDGAIHTRYPLHPMQVRDQAALRPEDEQAGRGLLLLPLATANTKTSTLNRSAGLCGRRISIPPDNHADLLAPGLRPWPGRITVLIRFGSHAHGNQAAGIRPGERHELRQIYAVSPMR